MAIFDAMLEFSDDQAITTTSATYASDNTFNWADSDLEMGAGEPLWFNCRVGTVAFAATSGSTEGACTLIVDLVNETATAGGDPTIDSGSEIMYRSRTFTEDEMIKGAWLVRIPLPYDIDSQQHLGVLYTIAGDDLGDQAKIDTWIDHGPQSSFDTQVSASNI